MSSIINILSYMADVVLPGQTSHGGGYINHYWYDNPTLWLIVSVCCCVSLTVVIAIVLLYLIRNKKKK